MNRLEWNKLARAADDNSAFARRLIEDPVAAASSVGVELSTREAAALRAFADGLPSTEALSMIAPAEVELTFAVNH